MVGHRTQLPEYKDKVKYREIQKIQERGRTPFDWHHLSCLAGGGGREDRWRLVIRLSSVSASEQQAAAEATGTKIQIHKFKYRNIKNEIHKNTNANVRTEKQKYQTIYKNTNTEKQKYKNADTKYTNTSCSKDKGSECNLNALFSHNFNLKTSPKAKRHKPSYHSFSLLWLS